MNPQQNLLIAVFLLAAMYFLMIRPNSKRNKKEQEMRNNIAIGNEIVTIGGIVGKVISIKEDTESLIIESGVDRCRIKIKKWAISSCETQKNPENK